MKVNIFKVSPLHVEEMLKKFSDTKVNLILESTKNIWDWKCDFYLSDDPEIKNIPWVKYYKDILAWKTIENKIYFSAYVCSKWENIFVVTHGKTHFYVRNYCESEFWLSLATRIANEKDVKQVASKRFAWKKKKEIKSYTKNTTLDPESGESIDYISAGIIDEKRSYFWDTAKFWSSVLFACKDLEIANLTDLLDRIITTCLEDPKFGIPKTEVIVNKLDIARYDVELLGKINQSNGDVETTSDSHDIVWVDFVFSWDEHYAISYPWIKTSHVDSLDITVLRDFIKTNYINSNDVFDIKVKIEKEDQKSYFKKLKQHLDYVIEDENIVLQNWKWIRFNEDYINELNISVDSLEIEPTESEFQEILTTETIFNDSSLNTNLTTYSYTWGDKDFSKLKVKWNYKVEAWDLQKWDTVYAVKFWTTQKLVYVCNQAIATLEIIRNKSSLKKLDNPPKKYCLWLWFEREDLPSKISEINSIILKQQIDTFARKCRELWIEPMLKFSKRSKPE